MQKKYKHDEWEARETSYLDMWKEMQGKEW